MTVSSATESTSLITEAPTFFNSLNARNIVRSSVYTLSAPIVAIGSVVGSILCVTCGCLAKSNAGWVYQGNDPKTGQQTFSYNDDMAKRQRREAQQNIDEGPRECIGNNLDFFENMRPYDTLVKTIINDQGDLEIKQEISCFLSINHNRRNEIREWDNQARIAEKECK